MAGSKDEFNIDLQDLKLDDPDAPGTDEQDAYEAFAEEMEEYKRGKGAEDTENAKEKGKDDPSSVLPGDRYRDSISRLHTLGEEDDTDQDHSEDDRPQVKRRRTASDYVRYCIMVIALGVFVYAVFQLVTIFMEYKAAEDEYDNIVSEVQDDKGEHQQETVVEYIEQDYPLNPDFHVPVIDWQQLKEMNPDIIGWIQSETIPEINYPVVHGPDNDYYLHRTFMGESNSAGSIFIEAQNKTDFSDVNTFVYGHNMKNNSMFGTLRNYKEESFYHGNEYFWIYTPQGNYRYKIFSCYEPHADSSETYTWWSDPCDEFTDYLNRVKSYSKYDTGVVVKPTDRIVTLSTCTSRGSTYRFVAHGKMVYSEAVNSNLATPAPTQEAQTPAQPEGQTPAQPEGQTPAQPEGQTPAQ